MSHRALSLVDISLNSTDKILALRSRGRGESGGSAEEGLRGCDSNHNITIGRRHIGWAWDVQPFRISGGPCSLACATLLRPLRCGGTPASGANDRASGRRAADRHRAANAGTPHKKSNGAYTTTAREIETRHKEHRRPKLTMSPNLASGFSSLTLSLFVFEYRKNALMFRFGLFGSFFAFFLRCFLAFWGASSSSLTESRSSSSELMVALA